MQFTLSKLFAFTVAAQAISIASAASVATAVSPSTDTNSPVPQDFVTAKACTNPGMSGSCGNVSVTGIPSSCLNFIASFNDVISSIQVNPGFSCKFFVDPGCSGAVLTVTGTANDLSGTNFDNSISSVQCFNGP
ncbi:hypothetical protein MSAN_01312200 [Mycena sanguinolenta]|uniref:Uncharacterized protein n=1 Tax=Mycena sanguinolenta TaxID=230812 RepID=A0A8H7D0M6_9AGAR|nr:hypothetical protein MSAN_01312200 [Mycena sanguinolenta]